MAIIFGGRRITRIIKDGVDIDVLKFGNAEVYRKRKLTINFKGANNARYGTYPLTVWSTGSDHTEIYGVNTTKEIYVPDGDRVYISLNNYRLYGADRNLSFYEESYFSMMMPTSSNQYTSVDINPDRDFLDYQGFSFTMDKDVIIDPYGANMGNIRDITEGTKTYAFVEFSAKSNVALTDLKAAKLISQVGV